MVVRRLVGHSFAGLRSQVSGALGRVPIVDQVHLRKNGVILKAVALLTWHGTIGLAI